MTPNERRRQRDVIYQTLDYPYALPLQALADLHEECRGPDDTMVLGLRWLARHRKQPSRTPERFVWYFCKCPGRDCELPADRDYTVEQLTATAAFILAAHTVGSKIARGVVSRE